MLFKLLRVPAFYVHMLSILIYMLGIVYKKRVKSLFTDVAHKFCPSYATVIISQQNINLFYVRHLLSIMIGIITSHSISYLNTNVMIQVRKQFCITYCSLLKADSIRHNDDEIKATLST